MLRHEQQSIAMALAAALHHSAGPWEKKVEMQQNAAPRGQNTPPPGARPGHPRGARATAERPWPASLRKGHHPTLGLPLLAKTSGEVVDASTLAFLTRAVHEEKRKDEVEKAAKVKVKEERRERQRRQALRQELVALLDPPVRSAQQENRINAILEILRGDAEGRSRFFFLPAGEEEDKEEEKEDETDECKGMDVLGVHVQLLFLMFLTILFFSFPLAPCVWQSRTCLTLPGLLEGTTCGLFWEIISGWIPYSALSGSTVDTYFCQSTGSRGFDACSAWRWTSDPVRFSSH